MTQLVNGQSGQIFLSYSRNDLTTCIAFRLALEQAGFSVFHDIDAIRTGDRWMERLEKALATCSAFVVLIGCEGVQRWVGAEVQIALMRHLSPHDDSQRLPIFPILIDGVRPEEIPLVLSLFQSESWAVTEPLSKDLLEGIRTRHSHFDSRLKIEAQPFLGLSAFRRENAQVFFGRRKETLEVLSYFGNQQQSNPDQLMTRDQTSYFRWLQIEGNSGAGKSSLLHAGILPMIEQGALWARTGFEYWKILGPMMPGREPVENLADVCGRSLIVDPTKRDSLGRLQRLQRDQRALALELKDFKQSHTAFLLVVDQFEELFTSAGDKQRTQFDALLAHALQDPECPLFLVSTVRADFLDRFELLPRLGALYNSCCRRYFLQVISQQGLREAIEGPARLAGLNVSEVKEMILREAENEVGALPLVENALHTLWEQRDIKGNRLIGDQFQLQGGIAGMLSKQADALLARVDAELGGKGRRVALELLLLLTRINDNGRNTRRRITRREAVAVAGNGQEVLGERIIQMLSGERDQSRPNDANVGTIRLITLSKEQEENYVDLIHETLIRDRGKDAGTGQPIPYWPTLYNYVEKNRDRDLLRQQLKFRTERWQHSKGFGRLRSLAYIGTGSYQALGIHAQTPEGKFLNRSKWAQRSLLSVVMILLVYIGEAYVWIHRNELPLTSMWTLQRYRMGYSPVPALFPIASGSFDMGEKDGAFINRHDDGERRYWGTPVHEVNIDKGFSLGSTEVTYEQYDYYVWMQHQSGHRKAKFPTTAKGGRGTHPVVNVNWYEAQAYSRWLGAHTKRSCRLPTEAEWEYAARAGTKTAYAWGDSIGENHASCNGCGGNWGKGEESAPVARFAANPWHLYDMSGNVWEWTCSAWRDNFDKSKPNEQQCTSENDVAPRVLRGGSWGYSADYARTSTRINPDPGNRSLNVGFRILCLSLIE